MEHEVSCLHSKAIINYLREHSPVGTYGLFGGLDPEIDALSDVEGFLEEPRNWISCKVAAELYKRARAIMKDDRVAFKIAQYVVETEPLGYVQPNVKMAFWSMWMGLKKLCKIHGYLNRNKREELVYRRGREAVVRIHWNPQMGSTKDFCLMSQGTFIHAPRVWGGRVLNLKENCCYFEGAHYCEYHLSWSGNNPIRGFISGLFPAMPSRREAVREREAYREALRRNDEKVRRLHLELKKKNIQLSTIQEIGNAILSIMNQEELLPEIMKIISDVCGINRVIIMLVNEKTMHLEYHYGAGFGGDVLETIKNHTIPLDRPRNILARVARVGKSEYIPEVNRFTMSGDDILYTSGNPGPVYVVPLTSRSGVIGVIAADGTGNQEVPGAARETLDVIASQISIAIENAKLYRQRSKQMEELKRSNALLGRAEKFSFLGNLSARLAHEIKNPMTAIGTFLQMLPYKYEDEEFRTNFYKIAREEIARVNNLITELLDLVKTREPHFQLHDLHDLIHRMILLVSPQSKAKKIEIRSDFDLESRYAWMDSEKMKQVVLNLLSNAVEYTAEGGQIEAVTRKCLENQGTRKILIEIRDTGVGILPEHLDKVFEPYFTTKNKGHMHNGTGLGLFIARQNMEDHGGTIEVRSTPNRGTVFILTLPEKPSILSPDSSSITGPGNEIR